MAVLQTRFAQLAPDRQRFIDMYRANRRRSAQIFAIVGNALYERPLVRRLPFIFYLGHLPVFSYITIAAAYGLPPLDAEFERLFARGIDPATDAEAAQLSPQSWPSVEAVQAYAKRADAAIEHLFATERLSDASVPMLRHGQALHTIIEHEVMHQETLLYLIACLDDRFKILGKQKAVAGGSYPVDDAVCRISAGTVVLGRPIDSAAFGWDNEFGTCSVDVRPFGLDAHPVSNRRYLEYVQAGATAPIHWFTKAGAWWLKTPVGALPLPLEWPVYVSHREAAAFARQAGARLMTEAEYGRAAYGTADGATRPYPWGHKYPNAQVTNADFMRYVPVANGATPAGRSAFGVHDLVGNGWEITATVFEPLPGFVPMASYPAYSADFFDGFHYVVKGASPVTAGMLLRPSLRNWFFDDYAYAFTKFRLAYD